MKRSLSISLIILILCSGFALNAQTKKVVQKKKTTISLDSILFKNMTARLEVGYNNPARFGSSVSSTYFNGVQIGFTAERALKNNFSLLTGVLYNLVYSDKLQKYPNSTSVNALSYGHFINIPLNLTYNLPASKDLNFFGFAGPKLNIGLSQTQGVISTYSGITTSYTSDMYKSKLNQLDLQIGVGGGVQWKKYQLKGGYDWGLLNMNKLKTGDLYQKGWYVSLSITL